MQDLVAALTAYCISQASYIAQTVVSRDNNVPEAIVLNLAELPLQEKIVKDVYASPNEDTPELLERHGCHVNLPELP